MSGNIELALLTRVIDDRDFHSVQKAQITEDYFVTPEAREVYRFLRETYHNEQTSGLVPSREMIRIRYPAFYFSNAPDPVPILCQHLRQEKVRMEIQALAQNLMVKAERDPLSAMAELRGEASKIAGLAEVGSDLSMASAYQMLQSNYNTVADSGGLLGIPYPWAQLNEETQGMQGGQFLILYGRPKSMKSWVGIHIGVHAYQVSRRRVLFYTREMSPMMVAQRTAAAMGRVDYKAFKNGKLQPELRERVFGLLREMLDDEKMAGEAGERQPYFIITSDRTAGGGGGGVGWLQAKIRDLKPDLVIVDGMYLMKDDRSGQRSVDWKQIAHISQDLKLTAQEFDIPLIGITQANRAAQKSKGDDLTELAFSDALGQDADAVFRVSKNERTDEHGIKHSELFLKAPGLREGKFDGIVIHGEPATNFGYIRTMVDEDNNTTEEGYGEGQKRGSGAPPPPGPSFRRQQQQFMDPKVGVQKR